jgi:hypothetical protein
MSESTEKGKLTASEMKPLYLGPTFYCGEYTLSDAKGKVKEKVTVDLTSSTIVNSDESVVSVPVGEIEQQQEIRKQNANTQWITLENEMAGSSIHSAASNQGYIKGYMPYYDWYLGCSPTATAMVLDWWSRNQGYSKIPDTSDGKKLINMLAVAMGTGYKWPFGDHATWPTEIKNGVLTVCKNCGYNGFKSGDKLFPSWNDVVNEVNANRPFVLSMLSSPNSKYGIVHTVAAVGYYIGGTQYVIIHDTWVTNDVYIQYNSWAGAMLTYVHY